MADEVAAAPLEQEKWADAWNADGMLCPEGDGEPARTSESQKVFWKSPAWRPYRGSSEIQKVFWKFPVWRPCRGSSEKSESLLEVPVLATVSWSFRKTIRLSEARARPPSVRVLSLKRCLFLESLVTDRHVQGAYR